METSIVAPIASVMIKTSSSSRLGKSSTSKLITVVDRNFNRKQFHGRELHNFRKKNMCICKNSTLNFKTVADNAGKLVFFRVHKRLPMSSDRVRLIPVQKSKA